MDKYDRNHPKIPLEAQTEGHPIPDSWALYPLMGQDNWEEIQRIEQFMADSLSQLTHVTQKKYAKVEEELLVLFSLFDDFI